MRRPPTTRGGQDLFSAAADDAIALRAPLAARMRPRSLDEIVGQRHLLGPGAPLRALVEADRLSSAILWGPPGSGKTTFVRVLAETTSKHFEPLSAVTAGVKDVREVLQAARERLGQEARGTILFLDEVHRFNKAQQDALLPGVEEGLVVLIGATTENPFFELNAPLLSRSTLFRFEPLDHDDLRLIAERALEHEGAEGEARALARVVDMAEGDARVVLTTLEVALALARAGARASSGGGDAAPGGASGAGGDELGVRSAGAGRIGTGGTGAGDTGGRIRVTLADVEQARTTRALRFGRDEHYDLISVFIKSIRGSDPDAGLYWLARMIDSGEDPRFVARRLVILASEDVGMADPTSLLVAGAAARAVEFVGLPEAGLNLAQAVVHLACAPKSNRAAVGWWRAQKDVREQPAGAVPAEFRDAHYRSAGAIGHGSGYEYPHDDPEGWIPAEYRPAETARHRYYEPSDRGAEREIGRLLAERRAAVERVGTRTEDTGFDDDSGSDEEHRDD